MKSTEFITESLDEYDGILQGLLKIVNYRDTHGKLPFGLRPWHSKALNLGGMKPEETINTMLAKLGVKARLNAATTSAPGYSEMTKGLSHFIRVMSPKQTYGDEQKTFDRKDIADLAKKIYNWSKAGIEKQNANSYYRDRK